MTKRRVELPGDTKTAYDEYISSVGERLDSSEPLGDVVQSVLIELNGEEEHFEAWNDGRTVSKADRIRLMNYHPDNAAIESEWYAEKDESAFHRSKSLQWLWRQFDRTPFANNVVFGLSFRQMLAKRLFSDAGDHLRIFRDVTMSYGHNISIGDNTVIHDSVHLDDRGRLTIGDRVSLSEGVHIYSHDHDIVDQTEITNYHTIIEDDARITYDAMIRGGVRIGENALVGGKAVVQSDVPAHHVVVGAPAKTVRIKPGWESVAADPNEDTSAERENRKIVRAIPDSIDKFDEFQRSLQPPD